MAAEHRGSASLAVVPGSGLSNMPAEIQELGQKGGCSPFGGEETQMPPGVRGQMNVGVRRPRGCFQYLPAEKGVRFKTLPSSPTARQNRTEVPERIRKTSGLPSPLKLKSTTFNMTLRVCTIPPNMANVVIMLPISAEGYLLLQEASPDFPGSLRDMLSKHHGLLSFTTLLTIVIKFQFI